MPNDARNEHEAHELLVPGQRRPYIPIGVTQQGRLTPTHTADRSGFDPMQEAGLGVDDPGVTSPADLYEERSGGKSMVGRLLIVAIVLVFAAASAVVLPVGLLR